MKPKPTIAELQLQFWPTLGKNSFWRQPFQRAISFCLFGLPHKKYRKEILQLTKGKDFGIATLLKSIALPFTQTRDNFSREKSAWLLDAIEVALQFGRVFLRYIPGLAELILRGIAATFEQFERWCEVSNWLLPLKAIFWLVKQPFNLIANTIADLTNFIEGCLTLACGFFKFFAKGLYELFCWRENTAWEEFKQTCSQSLPQIKDNLWKAIITSIIIIFYVFPILAPIAPLVHGFLTHVALTGSLATTTGPWVAYGVTFVAQYISLGFISMLTILLGSLAIQYVDWRISQLGIRFFNFLKKEFLQNSPNDSQSSSNLQNLSSLTVSEEKDDEFGFNTQKHRPPKCRPPYRSDNDTESQQSRKSSQKPDNPQQSRNSELLSSYHQNSSSMSRNLHYSGSYLLGSNKTNSQISVPSDNNDANPDSQPNSRSH